MCLCIVSGTYGAVWENKWLLLQTLEVVLGIGILYADEVKQCEGQFVVWRTSSLLCAECGNICQTSFVFCFLWENIFPFYIYCRKVFKSPTRQKHRRPQLSLRLGSNLRWLRQVPTVWNWACLVVKWIIYRVVVWTAQSLQGVVSLCVYTVSRKSGSVNVAVVRLGSFVSFFQTMNTSHWSVWVFIDIIGCQTTMSYGNYTCLHRHTYSIQYML